jgi:hypothetical protein
MDNFQHGIKQEREMRKFTSQKAQNSPKQPLEMNRF